MPYDQTLDQECFKETKDFGETRVSVGVFSYNGASKKLQLSRENKDRNTEEWRFAKLGRLTKQEVQEILPLMTKAADQM